MSTQISSVIQESYEIFQRIFSLLDQPQFDWSLFHSKDKLGSRQIDKTFEQSVVKSKYSKMNEIASRIQQCLVQHFKNENQEIQKYEEQLQFLQAKLRKQIKNQIENRILIETLQEENNDLRKQIITLKDDLIDKHRALEGTQLKMMTQIKTLQSQISSLRRLDNLISDNNCALEISAQKVKTVNQESKKKTAISQIKNRLSLCDMNDFHANLFETLTPNTFKHNKRTTDYEIKIDQKKEKKRSQNTASRRSSYSSLSRKQLASRQPLIKECQKTTKNAGKKNKKNLKIKEVEPSRLKNRKKELSRSSSKLKVKK